MRLWALVLIAASGVCRASGVELVVTGVAFSECGGAGRGGEVLAELLRSALAERGVGAQVVPPPSACAAPDAPACLRALLALLASGALHVALAPAAAAALPPPPRLRDAGVGVWGTLDAVGSARRACWVTVTAGPATPAPRSLLDLRDPTFALHYREFTTNDSYSSEQPRYFCPVAGAKLEGQVAPCEGAERLATAFVGDKGEARVVASAALEHGLLLQVCALGAGWDAARALQTRVRAGRAALLCGRDLRLGEVGARALGPPPCADTDAVCPFDARPILKLANAPSLARAPSAARALDRLRLGAGGAAGLATLAAVAGAGAAAGAALAELGAATARGEVRVAVLVPEAEARALAAAAELAEADEADEARWAPAAAAAARFKVEVAVSECAAPGVLRYLVGALGAEFHSLSAVAGPPCASAFAATARQGAELVLPVLAYTPQMSASALLAAGSTLALTPALAALLAALGWRRIALLSETGLRPALDTARLGATLTTHVELPDEEQLTEDLIEK